MGLIDDLTNKLQFSTQAKEFAQSVTVINDANYKLADGLVKTIAVNEEWAKSYESVINQSLQLELRNKALNSAFSISTTAAAKLSQTYYKVAEQFKISGEQVMKYGINLKKIAPLLNQNNASNSVYIKGLLATHKIIENNGILIAGSGASRGSNILQFGWKAPKPRATDDLDVLTLHSYKISSIFDLPTDLSSEIVENQYTNKLSDYHYYEFTTNFIKNDSAGILSTHEVLTNENTYKPISEFIVGDYVKSYYISPKLNLVL